MMSLPQRKNRTLSPPRKMIRTYIDVFNAIDDINVLQLFIDAKVGVNAENEFHETPLHLAVAGNKLDAAQMLIDAGANVNALDDRLQTPIFRAVAKGHLSLACILIKAGAYVNVRGKGIIPLLNRAALRNDIDMLKCLIKFNADVNARDEFYETALHIVVRKNNFAAAELLVSRGANINAVNSKLITPLYIAVENENLWIVHLLLRAGANIFLSHITKAARTSNNDIKRILMDAGAINLRFPLVIAVFFDDIQVVENLILLGSNMNERYLSYSILKMAFVWHKFDIVQLLVRFGVDLDVGPVLCWAYKHPADQATKMCLIKAGCNVNEPDNGMYPLHYAAENKECEIVELLLRYGADINCRNKYNTSPLHLVVCKDWFLCKNMVKLLVASGADLNCQDHIGYTPLHYAAINQNTRAALYLLKMKADPLIRNKAGKTAFCIAEGIAGILLHYAILYNPELEIPHSVTSDFDFAKHYDEVSRMKNQLFTNGIKISLHDFVMERNRDALAYFAYYSDMPSLQEVKRLYTEHYPEYANLIIHKFMKGKTRALLLSKCNIIMKHSELASLPPEIRRNICKRLKNSDLDEFVASAFEEEYEWTTDEE